MPKVRTISRGTPISTEVLGDHANAINALYDDIAGHTTGVVINRPDASQVSSRIMDAQVWAQQKLLATQSKVTANAPVAWSVAFSPAFADVPVVTTGLVVHAESPSMAKRGIVAVSSVSAAGAEGTVTFPEDGSNVKVSIDIIAIGLSKT